MTDISPLRPPFCRLGSKRDIADRIIKLFPNDISTYVEPFVGSGAVFWKKPRHTKEVLNDIDIELIKDYKRLKATKSRNFRTYLDTVPEIQAFVNKTPSNDADKLTWSIASRCNKFGFSAKNIADGKIYRSANPYNKLKNIEEYQARLKNVVITNMSYEKVIQKYDSPTSLFYCDPPYESIVGRDKKFQPYKHNTFDQQSLQNVLSNIRGKFLLSINDSPTIRKLYRGFYYIVITIEPKSFTQAVGGKPRKELLIANYPISGRRLGMSKIKGSSCCARNTLLTFLDNAGLHALSHALT